MNKETGTEGKGKAKNQRSRHKKPEQRRKNNGDDMYIGNKCAKTRKARSQN